MADCSYTQEDLDLANRIDELLTKLDDITFRRPAEIIISRVDKYPECFQYSFVDDLYALYVPDLYKLFQSWPDNIALPSSSNDAFYKEVPRSEILFVIIMSAHLARHRARNMFKRLELLSEESAHGILYLNHAVRIARIHLKASGLVKRSNWMEREVDAIAVSLVAADIYLKLDAAMRDKMILAILPKLVVADAHLIPGIIEQAAAMGTP